LILGNGVVGYVEGVEVYPADGSFILVAVVRSHRKRTGGNVREAGDGFLGHQRA